MQSRNIDKRELRLVNFDCFLDSFIPQERHIFHLGSVALNFFYMAEDQAAAFTDAARSTIFSHENRSLPVYSYVVGGYVCLRTCLEASSNLTREFINRRTHIAELEEYKTQHRESIKNIVDVCNNYIKHPLVGQDSEFYYDLGGFDTDGNVKFYQYSAIDTEHLELLTVNLRRDLEKVFDYLEGLAQIYIRLLPVWRSVDPRN